MTLQSSSFPVSPLGRPSALQPAAALLALCAMGKRPKFRVNSICSLTLSDSKKNSPAPATHVFKVIVTEQHTNRESGKTTRTSPRGAPTRSTDSGAVVQTTASSPTGRPIRSTSPSTSSMALGITTAARR